MKYYRHDETVESYIFNHRFLHIRYPRMPGFKAWVCDTAMLLDPFARMLSVEKASRAWTSRAGLDRWAPHTDGNKPCKQASAPGWTAGRTEEEEEESSRPKGPTHTERLAKLTRTRSLSAPPVYRGPSRREVTGQAGVPKDPPLPLDVLLRQGRASARPTPSRRRRREARRRRPACI